MDLVVGNGQISHSMTGPREELLQTEKLRKTTTNQEEASEN